MCSIKGNLVKSISHHKHFHIGVKYLSILLIILISLSILISYSRQPSRKPITYFNLCGITPDQMGTMDDEAVRNWIAKKYGAYHALNLDTVLAAAGQETGSVTGYTWGTENEFHGEVYLRNGHLIRVSLFNVKNSWTFGQVIDTIGLPDWVLLVASVRDPVLYYFQLDYPQLGFSIGYEDLKSAREMDIGKNFAIQLQEGMAINWIDCYSPGQMKTVLENDFFLSETNVSVLMQARTIWSGFGAYIPLTK